MPKTAKSPSSAKKSPGMMFESGYTPGCIASLLSGNQNDLSENLQSTQFTKPDKSSNKAIQEHRERTKLVSAKVKENKQQVEEKKKNSGKVLNKEKEKLLKNLAATHRSGTSGAPEKDHSVHHAPEKEKRNRKEQRERAKKIKSSMADQNKRTVFVGNLPNTMKKKKVTRMFREYGTVESIRFRSAAPANPKMPKKGIVATGEFHPQIHTLNAYVVFKDSESAEKATELNGHQLEDQHIRVDYLGNSAKHNHKMSIFVGNLAFDTLEEDVREHFNDCGEIVNVRLIKDKFTRLGKGFGYVLFKEADAVLLALKLDSQKFKGRKIRIQRSTAVASKPESKTKKKNSNVESAQGSNSKKRKMPDSKSGESSPKKTKITGKSDSGVVHKKLKNKDQVVAKFSGEGGKLTFRNKEKHKKKLRHRVEKKKKQRFANILSGNKNSDLKKKVKKDKSNPRLGHSNKTGTGTQRKHKSKT